MPLFYWRVMLLNTGLCAGELSERKMPLSEALDYSRSTLLTLQSCPPTLPPSPAPFLFSVLQCFEKQSHSLTCIPALP